MTRFALLLAAGVSALSMASAAQAADLIVNAPAAAGIVETSSSWDGAFIGVFGGGAWGDLTDDYSGTMSGWLLGVDAGVNVTVADGIVLGVVGDLAWSNVIDEFDDVQIDWMGSLRGRIGFDGGAFMPYLTAGAAFAGATDSADVSNTHIGWTVGAGLEVAVSDNASLDLQYRYSDFGAQDYAGSDVGFTTNTFTAGLHWRF